MWSNINTVKKSEISIIVQTHLSFKFSCMELNSNFKYWFLKHNIGFGKPSNWEPIGPIQRSFYSIGFNLVVESGAKPIEKLLLAMHPNLKLNLIASKKNIRMQCNLK